MTFKKSLENRIRGWFPEEPQLPNRAPSKINFQINQQPQPPTNHYRVDTASATKFMGFQTIIWTLFSFLFIVQINAQNHIQLTSQINWIIAGLTVGSILSAIVTQKQLKHLAKYNELRVTKATILISVGVAIILIGIFTGLGSPNLPASALYAYMTSVFASGPTFSVTRFVLFTRFESKTQMRVLQHWVFGNGFFVVPKSGTGKHVNE